MATVNKAWLKSTTIWGLLVIGLGMGLNAVGLPVALADTVLEHGGTLIEGIGFLIAARGRKNADKPLGGIL